MTVVHRREHPLVAYLYGCAKRKVDGAIISRIVDAQIGRNRQPPQLLREGDIVRLFTLRSADAVRAGTEDHRRLRVRLRKGEPVGDWSHLANGGVDLDTGLERGREPVAQGRSPLRAVVALLRIDKALTELPLTSNAAPPEQRAFARSAGSLGHSRALLGPVVNGLGPVSLSKAERRHRHSRTSEKYLYDHGRSSFRL
jgi:hypothetical protein